MEEHINKIRKTVILPSHEQTELRDDTPESSNSASYTHLQKEEKERG